MRFLSLGSSNEIGASCHLVTAAGRRIVLDAGADPNQEGIPSLPRYDLIREADAVFVTHAHHDHLGGLPNLLVRFPHVPVYLTPATAQLSDFMLYSSMRLQVRKQQEGSTPHAPLFDQEDVDSTVDRFRTRELNAPFAVPGGHQPMEATFYSAGHVLGAAGVLLEWNEDGRALRLFYTSDTKTGAQAIIPGGRYPESVDILVLESTLGADESATATTRAKEEARFGRTLAKVLARGGCALVPVFMLGRAQEVLAVIDRLKAEGTLRAETPVYTAGGMREVSRIYDQTRQDTPRLDEAFEVYHVDQRRHPRKRNKVRRALRQGGIFVLASGMLFEHTASNRLAQLIVEEEQHAILIVGYCKDDSPGGRLLAAWQAQDEGVLLDGQSGFQPLACQVDRFRFSGHSHRKELVGLAKRMQPDHIVLVHGDTGARNWMAGALRVACPDAAVHRPDAGIPLVL